MNFPIDTNKGCYNQFMTELKVFVGHRHGDQKRALERLSHDSDHQPPMLQVNFSRVLNGKLNPPKWLLKHFGYDVIAVVVNNKGKD